MAPNLSGFLAPFIDNGTYAPGDGSLDDDVDTMVYLCSSGRVLDRVSNRRHFLIPCATVRNSTYTLLSQVVPNWPMCLTPTHCNEPPKE